MALIKCIECQQEVSENATSCPHCGNPLKANTVNVQTAPNHPVELELTSKKWKKVMLFSTLILIVCFILFFSDSSDGRWVWFVVGFFSFVSLIVGKIGAWYSNR